MSDNKLDTKTSGPSDLPDMKLELVPVPVSDVERAKEFYEKIFGNLRDTQVTPQMRVIQFTPPGSACSIVFGTGMGPISDMNSGSVKGLHLVVEDIIESRNELIKRGVDVGEVQDMAGPKYAYLWQHVGTSTMA